MSKKFVTTKELALIDEWNKELIQKFVEQEVIYYGISVEHTVVDDLYNESVTKFWYSPVRINARVRYDNPNTLSTNLTQDSQYTLDVFFHTQELIERNVEPREGDFVEFGEIVFEVTSVSRPQLVYGQVNKKINTKCVCVPSREGQMAIYGDSSRFIERTHPVEPSEC